MRKSIISRWNKRFCFEFFSFVFLFLLAGSARAQSNYEGSWYISNGSNCYLVPTIGAYYLDNVDMPYLTTYATGKDANSIWRIVKAGEDEESGETYYHFIHNLTGKYLTQNGIVIDGNNNDKCRLRFHLESFDSPSEATLFIIAKHSSNGGIAIRAKGYDGSDNGNSYVWIDVANGNKGNYWNGNYEGSLGVWYTLGDKDRSASRNLETADATCATPVITHNEGKFSIKYPIAGEEVSIHYTTDGTEPTETSATYSGDIPEAGVTMVRAVAVKEGYANSAEARLYSPTRQFLIRSAADNSQSYHIVPPLDETSTTDLYATTSNVPTPKMGWLLKPASKGGSMQFYYLVNAATGKYMYCNVAKDAGNAIVMKQKGEDGTDVESRYQFCLYEREGHTLIVPQIHANVLPTTGNKNMLYKSQGNDGTNYICLYSDNDNGYSRWQFIPVADEPRTMFTCPLASTESNKIYFKVENASNQNYHLSLPTTPNGTPRGYCTASTTDVDPEWCLEEAADADQWTTYYYLRNGNTGRYLYFNGTANANNNNLFLVSNNITAGDEDKYKFVVVRTANTNCAGSYHIIPKSIKDSPNQVKIALNRDNSSLRTQDSRNANASCWNLNTEGVYTVAPPFATYNATDNTIQLTSTTSGAAIYYTTDGTEPSTSSTPYNAPFALPDNVSIIKSIAVKGGESSAIATHQQPIHVSTDSQKRIFYIQSVHNTNFYLIPGRTNGSNVMVNTLSLPRPAMQWYALDAGVENDVQYYYLVNNHADNNASANTLGYLYCNGGSANMKSEFESSDDNYKFTILEHKTNGEFDGFHIMAKAKLNADAEKNALQKNGNNNTAGNDDVSTVGNSANTWARWNIVTEQPTQHIDFTISTAEQRSVYTIGNAGQTGYITPPATTYATLAADADNDEAWYIQKAASDGWVTYHYIVHANTGMYLYFDGTTTKTNDEERITLRDKTAGNEDQYQFAIANTIDANQYYIIPKVHKYAYNNQYYLLYKVNNAMTLKTSGGRPDQRGKWIFTPFSFTPSAPKFTYTIATREMVITSATSGATIYYALGGSEPTISDEYKYTGPFSLPEGTTIVRAFATFGGENNYQSETIEFTLNEVVDGNQITNMSGFYILGEGFTPGSDPIGTKDNPFRGTIDGGLRPITSLTHPLVGYAEEATIRNVIVKHAEVSDYNTEGHAGSIVGVALGDSRIYNCGVLDTTSTVSGANYVGGIAGLIDGSSRVINCYSYATITGGSHVGGIVGYNNATTTAQNIKTMVMNCMFYGDITGGTNIAPIYNGNIISNIDANGVGNYNYFYGGASYMTDAEVASNYTYNCALMAEERYLTRFEFFRHLLNSHRKLAAWYATGDYGKKDEMMKWVLLPDSLGTAHPYPILKTPGYYPSVVNYAPSDENIDEQNEHRNEGRKLGTLTVNIQMGSGGAQFGAPKDAKITTSLLTLNITDKDPNHYNFNYYKVQLPYYNDVATGNYRKASDGTNRVVTGWKIVGITTDGTVESYNSFTTGDDATADAEGNITATPYNFADRKCTAKDLYSETNKRVFNQGAYWDVPEGVTAITIEPYWAKAAYLADSYADVVYDKDMKNAYNVPNVGGGQIYTNGNDYDIDDEVKTVYTSTDNARNALGTDKSHTVYDYAIVLVGNVHKIGVTSSSADLPYTIMSADFDHDNEPDYSYILRFNSRNETHPVRLDFINIPGLGMAQKSTGGTGTYNFGICQPIGWFESTNTSLFRVTQFEYAINSRGAAPLILQGGVIEQWVSSQNNSASNKTTYFHVGGNVWFKEFHRGTHQDQAFTSKHPPISVTGGDYDEFYLTGLYRGDVASYNDNAECYINGGRFGILAGAGQEGIGDASKHVNGNIIWQIQNADIDEFYGGGINAAHPVEGNITTVITGGHIKQFCGGPKFGDMNSGRTVKTTATNCIFDNFYGAGYGGNSYSRRAPPNQTNKININWNNWVNGNEGYSQKYDAKYGGVETQINYQFLPMSGNADNVCRLFVEYVSFSLATAHDVTSRLTGCTVKENFYGGGRLGKVDGPVTSILTDCTVRGNVFGAGYSASLPTVEVMDLGGFQTEPRYNEKLGIYHPAVFPATQTYRWEQVKTVNSKETAIKTTTTEHILYTTENLGTLGTVTGKATLTIGGKSIIGTPGVAGDSKHGNVFGGGEESAVNDDTSVTLQGQTEVMGSVYGGGYQGVVGGNTSVEIKD